MTREELFKIIFPEANFSAIGCGVLKCNSNGCKYCKYLHYWDEEAVIPKIVAKNILNSAYGACNYYDTDSMKIDYLPRGEGKRLAQELSFIQQGWSKLPTILNITDWSTIKEIIDDALDNGFEVQILNGTIYYREKE